MKYVLLSLAVFCIAFAILLLALVSHPIAEDISMWLGGLGCLSLFGFQAERIQETMFGGAQ